MNKKILFIALFIFILATYQVFGMGLKAEGTLGANTLIMDLGFTFCETENSYFTTGLSYGQSSGVYFRGNEYWTTEYDYELGQYVETYKTEKEEILYCYDYLGIFLEYAYKFNFVESSIFSLGTEVGAGVRACYYFGDIGFDTYPRLDLIIGLQNFSLNLGYKFIFKYDSFDFGIDNCFSVGVKYSFGTNSGKSNSVNRTTENSNKSRYRIIDSDLATF